MTAPVREERRLVTVLAADIVGSTPLAERLDPEEVRLLLGELIGRFVRAVETFGGTVKDIAGDGVMALFGAPAAHEDDAERAVLAGLRIVEETRAYALEVAGAWGVAGLAVRVAVHTGPVVLGPTGVGEGLQHAAFGDTLHTAARLQSSTDPNTLLVSAATHRLVAQRFEWGDARTLALKGKEGPVTACPVLRARMGAERTRLRREVLTPFVGRERECAEGGRALQDALSGSGGVLFILGEPGIGKSRLVLELRHRFLRSPAAYGAPRWIEGRCVSYGETLPYWPYRDLLREWLGLGPDAPEVRVRVALRREVERLFPDGVERVYPYLAGLLGVALEPQAARVLAPLSPEALQYRTFEVVRQMVARLAQEGPLVLVIEDLHWADPTSLHLTQDLLAVTEDAPVLLVLIQRPERDHPSWGVRERAAREFPHRTREIVLAPLSGDAEREMLWALVGKGTLPPALEDALLARAEGNPFYLEELVRSLADAGALLPAAGGWRFDHAVPLDLPPTVEQVVLTRIDRLPAEAREVLVAASVLGRCFTLPHLEALTDGADRLRQALHDLQRADLLHAGRHWPSPEYRFKHALIQEAAYRTLLTPQRRELHRRAARWLEEVHRAHPEEVLDLLAHHWLAAQDEEKAITYLTQAGDRARLAWSLDEAVAHYRALLPLLERRGERRAVALVLFKLALALHTALRFEEANAVYQEAFAAWSPPDPFPGPATATLHVAQTRIPWDADPTRTHVLQNIQLAMAQYDRLVERWPEATIVPALAEWWEVASDGLRYTFRLRPGVRWSDGVPITAHDVVFALRRVLDPERPGASATIYDVLEGGQDYRRGRLRDPEGVGVRALDDRTVEYRLAAPAPYFLSVLNRPDAGPLPRHAIARDGEGWTAPGRQVVSGAFRCTELRPDRVVLERREDDRWPRRGNVRRVCFLRRSVDEAAVEYARGDLDLADVRTMVDLTPLYAVAADHAVPAPAAGGLYLVFDHSHPLLGRREARLALAHAVDREALRSVAPPHVLVATGGIVPPALQGHTPDIVPRFDAELAREWLRRAGGDGSPGLALVVWEGISTFERLAGPLVHGWREVLGVDVSVVRLDLTGAYGPAPAPLTLQVWYPGYPDPEYFLRLLLHSEAQDNWGGFRHPPFDDLVERARQTRDGRRRLELFHQADRMAVAEQAALLPLAYIPNIAFVQPWVSGWWEFGKSWSNFSDLVVAPSSPRA